MVLEKTWCNTYRINLVSTFLWTIVCFWLQTLIIQWKRITLYQKHYRNWFAAIDQKLIKDLFGITNISVMTIDGLADYKVVKVGSIQGLYTDAILCIV